MTVKQQILLMLQEAENLMLTEATVQNKTLDAAELADADVEDTFEALRERFNALTQAVEQHVD